MPCTDPALVFPGLEIRLHQRRVLKDGADIYLPRLEYGALCYLAASPGRVFTKAQIFESVWSMESESCQSSVTSVICNLRKKIEPDSKNPTVKEFDLPFTISIVHCFTHLFVQQISLQTLCQIASKVRDLHFRYIRLLFLRYRDRFLLFGYLYQ